jgi:translation initiation factor 3 subunit B
MENGYHLYDFKGQLLREEHIDGFKQFLWRPRPPTLLSKEEQSEIRKNLRNYSKIFDEQDMAKRSSANRAVIEQRRRLLDEWLAWRETVEREVEEEKEIMGYVDIAEEQDEADAGVEEVEEVVEEVIAETEEIVS